MTSALLSGSHIGIVLASRPPRDRGRGAVVHDRRRISRFAGALHSATYVAHLAWLLVVRT
jgi:hypothetical protein